MIGIPRDSIVNRQFGNRPETQTICLQFYAIPDPKIKGEKQIFSIAGTEKKFLSLCSDTALSPGEGKTGKTIGGQRFFANRITNHNYRKKFAYLRHSSCTAAWQKNILLQKLFAEQPDSDQLHAP